MSPGENNRAGVWIPRHGKKFPWRGRVGQKKAGTMDAPAEAQVDLSAETRRGKTGRAFQLLFDDAG
jgi:hypothetical protein